MLTDQTQVNYHTLSINAVVHDVKTAAVWWTLTKTKQRSAFSPIIEQSI